MSFKLIADDMKKTTFLCLSFATCYGLASCSEGRNEEKPVNVVFILADDLGYGDVGCYGQQIIHTPNIDKMASEGLLFTQAYSGCPVSAPSRCSLMTGLNTAHTQVRGNKEILPEGQQPMEEGTYTIAKLMQSAGYSTGMFGKWGLGYPGSVSVPNTMGFDEFFGYNCQRQSHTYYPDHLWHNGDTIYFPENANNARKTYSLDIIHRHALDFIKENKDKPFFAMLTYTLPHAELNLPHDSIYDQYKDKFKEIQYIGKFDNQYGGYNTSEKPYASYAAMVSRLDKYVGDVLDELKALGIEKNTLVIFTSDNGPHAEGGANPEFFNSAGPLRGIKRDVYEGGIRVPFIAWMPGSIDKNKRTDQVCAFWDILPTLADLTGTDLPVETDGISILPTLQGKGKKQQPQHDYLYWAFNEGIEREALRIGDMKLVRQNIEGATQTELFDLSKDISEKNNLANEQPETVGMFVAKMDSIGGKLK